jgi:hypothetical protein
MKMCKIGSHEGAVIPITNTGILQIEDKVFIYYVDKFLQRIAHKTTTSCLRVLQTDVLYSRRYFSLIKCGLK